MSDFFVFLSIFAIIVMISIAFSALQQGKKKTYYRKVNEAPSPIMEKNHAFHEPVGEYTENHADRIGRKLVTHEEPEPGYVVLNGIKRRIEDCKYL